MEAETVLKLFDSCWFGIQDMKEQEPCSSSSHENTNHQTKEGISESEEPMLLRSQTIHTRSMSDQLDNMTCSMHDDSSSPELDMLPSKLQTILSGKDIMDTEQGERKAQVQVQLEGFPNKKKNNNNTSRGRKKKRRGSKSLSDLEFEELKGFMDLGFVFSEEDKDSSLASILPGLQRLGKKSVRNEEDEEDDDDDDDEEDEENCDKAAVPRPYLSEAWKVHKKKKENPLKNWKVPALNNENDIKDSLKLWAHTVASNVR